ncbi:MAG: SirA family protein [Gammaproteobacteria bacterium]|nr:MAG: SirA family protein [Gammaproteobacteria bacterium]RLA23696.1 MAG: SirA family protein [Gammaproteobacteria bacterium]
MSKIALDLRGLLCPLPVIRVQDKIKTLQQGDELEVTCTDPGVMHDIPTWCRINGHSVLASRSSDYEFILNLQVGGSDGD